MYVWRMTLIWAALQPVLLPAAEVLSWELVPRPGVDCCGPQLIPAILVGIMLALVVWIPAADYRDTRSKGSAIGAAAVAAFGGCLAALWVADGLVAGTLAAFDVVFALGVLLGSSRHPAPG